MNGQGTPSGSVLQRLHRVLFQPAAELVMPVELKVLGWKKDGRRGVVLRGPGGPRSNGKPGDGAIRTGGGRPGAPRFSTPTPPATTAEAGCS